MPPSSRFTVAVHVLALLAMLREKPLSSRFIAGSVNTNPVVIRRILGILAEAGLVETRRGSGGGALLAVDPASIDLSMVYELFEEGELFSLHSQTPNPRCPCGRNIQPALVRVFDRGLEALKQELSGTSIAQVAAEIVNAEKRYKL
jgi:DNA-binding IscR family transcriptional regulator